MQRFREVRPIDVGQLRVGRRQVRTREINKALGELVDNIRVHGQLEPIIVTDTGDESYEIIAGQRRWLALKELGIPTALCAVLDSELDDSTAQALSISENLIREDVSAKDLIDACTDLYRKYGSVKSVADELGLPPHKVRDFVKFDRLRPGLKRYVEAGKIDVKCALRIEDHLGKEEPPEDQFGLMVESMAGLTNAQQAHFLRARRVSANDGASRDEVVPPGAVHQVLVTLSKENHSCLRQLAKSQRMTQDRAAAAILNAFFRSSARNPDKDASTG